MHWHNLDAKAAIIRSFRPIPRRYRTLWERRLERVKGIEPSSSAWKAVALPLSYTRVSSRRALVEGGLASGTAPDRYWRRPLPDARCDRRFPAACEVRSATHPVIAARLQPEFGLALTTEFRTKLTHILRLTTEDSHVSFGLYRRAGGPCADRSRSSDRRALQVSAQ
jgi:hypothetical protein